MNDRNRPQRISLVTCSYQQGCYIEATIQSVLKQAYPKLEYIIMDGGSTDATTEILARYRGSLSRVVSQRDDGQTDALIKGFAHSSGEIMGWLCSDDLLLPGALETVDQYFREHPDVMAVYGDALWIDADGKPVRPKREMGFSRFVFLYDHNYIPQPSMFWRRSLYEQVGGLDTHFDLAMDSDLWERFSRVTRIEHLPCYLSCMRYYPEQKTRSRRAEGELEDRAIRLRSPTHQRLRWLYPVCRALARGWRITRKAMSGGYGARVPTEYVEWLEHRGIEQRMDA